jgi:hypothetical protein
MTLEDTREKRLEQCLSQYEADIEFLTERNDELEGQLKGALKQQRAIEKEHSLQIKEFSFMVIL